MQLEYVIDLIKDYAMWLYRYMYTYINRKYFFY